MILTHMSLFSGIGGIDIAAEWAGFKSVGQCEMNDYACRVLQKNFGNIPRWRDVRDVTNESVWKECKTREITLLSGGFPCQPFSCAGKQRGEDDDRYLWPEMLRIVSELRPTWVLGENVGGFVSMALDNVLTDLESIEYETRAFLLPAAGVGAWHKRDRCFIVAHSGHNARSAKRKMQQEISKEPTPSSKGSIYSNDVANTDSTQCKGGELSGRSKQEHTYTCSRSRWETEPAVGRVVDGFPGRVDRLRCLGNAVVPQQVYPILRAIANVEKNIEIL